MAMTTLDPHRIVSGKDFGWEPEQLPFKTIPGLFQLQVKAFGDETMMRQKDLGLWRAYSWNQVASIAHEMGAGLVSLGFAPGEVASVLANTSREWIWSDLAIQTMGGVCNGIYPTDAAAQVEYICTDSASVFLLVEDEEQLDKFLEIRERLPMLRKVIVFDMEGLAELDDPQVMSLEALRALGRERLAKQPGLVQERIQARGPDDLAILVYTSGTTGKPKGAMITQANLCAALSGIRTGMAKGLAERGERIAFLPLCHVAERLIGAYVPLLLGQTVNYVENPETVFENLREVQPYIFFAVPRVWEKIYSTVAITVREAGRLQQLAYGWAISLGLQMAAFEIERKEPDAWLAMRYKLARLLVLNNVRRMIGMHRVELALTGAAPISPELIRWYLALGIPLREAWGMTETTGGGSINPARDGWRALLFAKFIPGFSTVAPPLAGIVGMGPARFLLYDTAGALIWAGLCAGVGALFSNQLEQVALLIDQTGGWFLMIIGAGLVGFIAYKFLHRQKFLRDLMMAKITVDELKQRMDAGDLITIVDVRHPMALELDPETIPGSLNFRMEEIEHRHHEIPRDRDIILYCSCPNEVSSARTAFLLKKKGVHRVRPLEGGLDAWRERKFPIERRMKNEMVSSS